MEGGGAEIIFFNGTLQSKSTDLTSSRTHTNTNLAHEITKPNEH